MTTRLDILLVFASQNGHGLNHATMLADDHDPDYIEWLEQKLAEQTDRLQHCLDSRVPHIYK